jgi:hypothetical protein
VPFAALLTLVVAFAPPAPDGDKASARRHTAADAFVYNELDSVAKALPARGDLLQLA